MERTSLCRGGSLARNARECNANDGALDKRYLHKFARDVPAVPEALCSPFIFLLGNDIVSGINPWRRLDVVN